MIHNTESVQSSQKEDGCNMYATKKILCSPGYHHNAFVATEVLGQLYIVWLIYSYTLLVPMNQKVLNKLNKECNVNGRK